MAARDSRYRVLALHLAAGKAVTDAAREAGVSERTAHRLLKKPGFARRVRRIEAQTRRRVVGQLTDACTRAVQTLLAMLDENSPATARLGAARAVLEHAGRMTETVELEARIAALEAAGEDRHAPEPAAAG